MPVVIHTGDTANPTALLKYSHPLTVDAVAVNFPRVQFVMAHYGNPFIVEATEVAKKNPNAVSYTHLDVYKRQAPLRLRSTISSNCAFFLMP